MNLFIFNYKQGRKRISEEIPAPSKVEAVRNFMQGVSAMNPITNLNIQSKYGNPHPHRLSQ